MEKDCEDCYNLGCYNLEDCALCYNCKELEEKMYCVKNKQYASKEKYKEALKLEKSKH